MEKNGERRILLIDDNTDLAHIIERLLEKRGVSAELADCGASGLRMLRGAPGRYALVLLDIHLPDMSGYEVLRQIREDPRREVGIVPVIAMSGDVKDFDTADFLHVFQKPFRFDLFIAEVLGFLEKEQE